MQFLNFHTIIVMRIRWKKPIANFMLQEKKKIRRKETQAIISFTETVFVSTEIQILFPMKMYEAKSLPENT